MELTKEQFTHLAAGKDSQGRPYEQHFDTAVHGDWSRYPGVAALEDIHNTLKAAGYKQPLNPNCQSCVLALLKAAGELYYTAKVMYNAPKKAAVATTKANEETKPKVEVKMPKKTPISKPE